MADVEDTSIWQDREIRFDVPTAYVLAINFPSNVS